MKIVVRNRETGKVARMRPKYNRAEGRMVIQVIEELPLFGKESEQVIAEYRTRTSFWRKWERVKNDSCASR